MKFNENDFNLDLFGMIRRLFKLMHSAFRYRIASFHLGHSLRHHRMASFCMPSPLFHLADANFPSLHSNWMKMNKKKKLRVNKKQQKIAKEESDDIKWKTINEAEQGARQRQIGSKKRTNEIWCLSFLQYHLFITANIYVWVQKQQIDFFPVVHILLLP